MGERKKSDQLVNLSIGILIRNVKPRKSYNRRCGRWVRCVIYIKKKNS